MIAWLMEGGITMSRFRRRLLMMMQKVQEIWRDVVLTGTGVIVATDTTEGQRAKIFPQGWTKQDGTPTPEIPVPILNAGTHNDGTGKYEYTLTVSDAEENPTNTQTVTLTSDRPLTQWDRLVYMDGKWQWEYSGLKTVVDEKYPNYLMQYRDGFYFYKRSGWDTNDKNAYCDRLPNLNRSNDTKFPFFAENYGNLNCTYAIHVSDVYGNTIEEIKENLKQNPLIFWHKASVPEYIPLQESEQQALNALKTYYPITVFSNNQEGFMQVEYRTKYGGDA